MYAIFYREFRMHSAIDSSHTAQVVVYEEDSKCQNERRWNGPKRTHEKANPHPHRQENLYGRKCTMSEKENMEQAPRNRQSPLDFPKRDALA